MGFLGLTNGFGHCSTNELSLGFFGFVGVGFWVGLFFLSLSLRAGVISLSLNFLSIFRKMIFEGKIKTEIILHPNTRSTEKHFQKIYFPCATKHPHLWKNISESDFHPKQIQPKMFLLFYQTKRHDISVFLNVNMAIICVATWRNKTQLTKSQTFRLLVIIYRFEAFVYYYCYHSFIYRCNTNQLQDETLS